MQVSLKKTISCQPFKSWPITAFLVEIDQQPFVKWKIDVIEHIERHHMAHSQRRDKCYFVSIDKGFIYNQLVRETMKRPDKSMPHRKLHKKGVRQKTFSEIVGVHGLSKDACYTVTVIYDTTNHKLITAFPTIWWKKAKRLERSEGCGFIIEEVVLIIVE